MAPPPMRNGMPYHGMPPPLMMIPGYGMAPMPPMPPMPVGGGGGGGAANFYRTKKSGTFSARGNKNKGDRAGSSSRALPPFMMPPNAGAGGPMLMMGPPPHPHQMGHPGMMGLPPPHMYNGGAGMPSPYGASYPMAGGVRPDSRHMEEPIYMPHSARPLSPVASYQPGHFPHDAYYSQQQYATIDKAGKYRTGNKNSKANGGIKHPHGPQQTQVPSQKQRGGGGGHPPPHPRNHPSSDSNAEESEFGAGIYKKGHINERAFAHSMRAEQRSRSYGSLANLAYDDEAAAAAAVANGGVMMMGVGEPGDVEGGGREMMQMMAELELDEERIERSEVPANFYPANGGQVGNHMYPPAVMNGHAPAQHHMLPPVNGHARRRR